MATNQKIDNPIIFVNEEGVTVGIIPSNLEASLEYIRTNKVKKIFFEEIDQNSFTNFDFLTNLNITSIAINNSKLDISNFPSIVTLHELFLNNFGGKIDFSKFPNLSECTMDWNEKIDIVSSSNKIEKLTVWHYTPKSQTVEELSNFKQLEFLKISQTNIVSLEGVNYFTHLKHLEIHYATKLITLKNVAKLKDSLKTLLISKSKKIQDHSKVSSLDKLEILAFNYAGNIPNIKFVKEMPSLKDFRFVDTNIEDGDLSPCIGLEYVGFLPKRHYSHKPEDFEK